MLFSQIQMISLHINEIKNNAWVTAYNEFFWSWVRWFGNDFHEWRSLEYRSLANHITRDRVIVIHGKDCIILFVTRRFMSRAHNSASKNNRSLISPMSLRKVFSDLDLWLHHIWSVTSRECQLLVLWRHIHRLLLHVQIGAEAIIISG